MRIKPLLIAVFASMLCGVPGTMRAQQAESAVPGQQQLAPEVKEFQTLEDQWSAAVMKNDQYTMEFLLSPLYVDISSTGDVTTRNQQIASLFQNGDDPVSMLQRVVSVREFGDTAIVSGTYIIKWRTSGSLKEERGIFTHIYNRARMHWACVNAQRTAVVELVPNRQKASKKSDAPEPFHIPLLYQGATPSTQSATGQNTAPPPN